MSVDAQEIFESKGITIFERLGTTGIQRVSKMSGVKTILDNLSTSFEPEQLIGTMDELKHVVIGNSSFIQFVKKDSGCFTLTVQHWSEDICDEIEASKFLFGV